MEKRCRKARSSSPSGPAPPQLRHDTVGGGFRDQINLLRDLYKIANDYLDFGRFPVSSVCEWSRRVQVRKNTVRKIRYCNMGSASNE